MTPDADDEAVTEPTPTEARLLARLGDALAPEGSGGQVPDVLVDAARLAFDWRDVDAELAALSAAELPAGVRGEGAAAAEALAFAGPRWTLEVELRAAGPTWIATGQVSPPVTASVAWESRAGGGAAVALGPAGMFELADVPRGPVRFVVAEEGRPAVRTDWVMA
jgi:hypothetical protein